jgi:hypothetical protein
VLTLSCISRPPGLPTKPCIAEERTGARTCFNLCRSILRFSRARGRKKWGVGGDRSGDNVIMINSSPTFSGSISRHNEHMKYLLLIVCYGSTMGHDSSWTQRGHHGEAKGSRKAQMSASFLLRRGVGSTMLITPIVLQLSSGLSTKCDPFIRGLAFRKSRPLCARRRRPRELDARIVVAATRAMATLPTFPSE